MKQVYLLFGTPKNLGCDRILAVYASYEAAQADFQSWMAAEEYTSNPQFDGFYILPFTVRDQPLGVKL